MEDKRGELIFVGSSRFVILESRNLSWRHGYHGWTSSDTTYRGNGWLYYIFVDTSQEAANWLNLNYSYDSFGNVKQHYDNAGYNNFSYDVQNRLTNAYSKSYSYDTTGRAQGAPANYEGTPYTVYEGHAPKPTGYSYDANGNLTSRASRTLAWNHENRLESVSGGGLSTESYLYDDSGIRVKKTTGSSSTYYVNQFYELAGSTAIKYYFFGGQRVAQKNGSTLYYLHQDHLGSTVLTTGTADATKTYRAYGNLRATPAPSPPAASSPTSISMIRDWFT